MIYIAYSTTVKFVTLTLLLFCALYTNGQQVSNKKGLDTSVFGKWAYVGDPAITNDGQFAAYTSQNGVRNPKTLTIKSTSGAWEKQVTSGVLKYKFSENSKELLYLDRDNHLTVLKLGTGAIQNSYEAKDFNLFTNKGGEWLMVRTPDGGMKLISRSRQKEDTYANVISLQQDKSFNRVFLIRKKDEQQQLSYIDLCSGRHLVVGNYNAINNLVINDTGDRVAFIDGPTIWLYKVGASDPEAMATNETAGIDSGLVIGGIDHFSHDGKRLFITLSTNPSAQLKLKSVAIKVWSYQDAVLKSDYRSKNSSRSYLAFLDLDNNAITRVSYEYENTSFLSEYSDRYIKVEHAEGMDYERHWNQKSKKTYYLYDCNEKRRLVVSLIPLSISSDLQYVIGWDSLSVDIKVYDLFKGKYTEWTKHLNVFGDENSIIEYDRKHWVFAGWVNQNHALLYDQNDIWEIDAAYPNHAVNLTKGIGKRNDITFRIASKPVDFSFNMDDVFLLSAFDQKNKQNGFYRIFHDRTKEPQSLAMSDHLYNYPENVQLSGFYPLKAKDTKMWIVRRESADSSRNYYLTADFISFKALSNLFPEQDYDWLTSELIDFKTLDGKPSQAILYKPANFNPAVKYPVIMNYYQKVSDKLNIYLKPDAMADNINIPWMVSKGYLICTPDIIYTQTKTGESVVNSIEGAASFLAKLPFVDSTAIGIDGQSFGSYETNYIITHSNYFKAALSSEGFSNLISAVVSVTADQGINYQDEWATIGQGRIGFSLWDRPDLYINNSPIFRADKVQTPLLMMANENDGIVNVSQGIEFFIALRRLHKQVWMLQYEGEDHSLVRKENKLDFTQKVQDFFDVFLKHKPLPSWMQQGF